MTRLTLIDVSSPADLGLAVYQKVQEVTRGKARRAASFLSEITCLELEGRDLTVSPWCVLVLFSLFDLAIHAPGVTLRICNWAVHYRTMARRSGDASAQEMASALLWAGCTRRNVELVSAVIGEPRSVDPIAVVPISCVTGGAIPRQRESGEHHAALSKFGRRRIEVGNELEKSAFRCLTP